MFDFRRDLQTCMTCASDLRIISSDLCLQTRLRHLHPLQQDLSRGSKSYIPLESPAYIGHLSQNLTRLSDPQTLGSKLNLPKLDV